MIESFTRNGKHDLTVIYYYCYHYNYSLEIFHCLLYTHLHFYLKFKHVLYKENLLVRSLIFLKWYCEQHFSLTIWTEHATNRRDAIANGKNGETYLFFSKNIFLIKNVSVANW